MLLRPQQLWSNQAIKNSLTKYWRWEVDQVGPQVLRPPESLQGLPSRHRGLQYPQTPQRALRTSYKPL